MNQEALPMGDARFPCPECGGELGFSGATYCKGCGWSARKPKAEAKRDLPGGKHDSNPNDCLCACGCGRKASIFPGTVRGGATHGWASGCWKTFEPIEPNSPVAAEYMTSIRGLLARRPELHRTPMRVPGQDDEERFA